MAVPNGVIPNDWRFRLTTGFVCARTVPAFIRALHGWGDDWGNVPRWRWPTYVPITCPVCGSPNLLEAFEVIPILIWTSCDWVTRPRSKDM